MGVRYNNYVVAMNNKVKNGQRRDTLNQALPIVTNIKLLATQNESLLNYFEAVSKECEIWATNAPTDINSLQLFQKNLISTFQSLSILKSKFDNFDKKDVSPELIMRYNQTVNKAKTAMLTNGIATTVQDIENLSSDVKDYKIKVKEAADKALRDKEDAKRKAEAAAAADARRLAKEQAQLRLAQEEEARRKKAEEEAKKALMIKYAMYGVGAIAAILLIKYILIPLIKWFVCDILPPLIIFTVVAGIIYLIIKSKLKK